MENSQESHLENSQESHRESHLKRRTSKIDIFSLLLVLDRKQFLINQFIASY
jgi:hypothetical protein